VALDQRAQSSVFECHISASKVKQLQKQMVKIISDQDKVNYFWLCDKDMTQRQVFGVAKLSALTDYIYV
jgi:CRISPR-associated endonuclease Cas2